MDGGSVTEWLDELKADRSADATQLWQRYVEKLVRLAHRKLGSTPRRAADEEDIVASAFAAFFEGVKDGRFARLDDHNNLWQILVMLTERKAIALWRRENREKHGKGRLRGESAFLRPDGSTGQNAGLDGVAGQEPTPAFAAEVAENLRELLDCLGDDIQRRIALGKLEGYTNKELASKLGISLRSVERKLEIIRDEWDEETQR